MPRSFPDTVLPALDWPTTTPGPAENSRIPADPVVVFFLPLAVTVLPKIDPVAPKLNSIPFWNLEAPGPPPVTVFEKTVPAELLVTTIPASAYPVTVLLLTVTVPPGTW